MYCRCEIHGWPDGDEHTSVAKIQPAGGRSEAITCGLCESPGDIYLNRDEYYRYEYEVKRLYRLYNPDSIQIQLSDLPTEVKELLTRDEDNPPNEPIHPVGGSAADTDW